MKSRNLKIALAIALLALVVGGTYLYSKPQLLKGQLGQVDEEEIFIVDGCTAAECAAGADAQRVLAETALANAENAYDAALEVAQDAEPENLATLQDAVNDNYVAAQSAADLALAYSIEADERDHEAYDAFLAASQFAETKCEVDGPECQSALLAVTFYQNELADADQYLLDAAADADAAQVAADAALQLNNDAAAIVAAEDLSDSDEDGLPFAREVDTYFTDPERTDTDGDGLSDGAEVNDYDTDPLNVNTDGDGISDYDEIFDTHTDPTLKDTDGDGLEDGEEQYSDTDPTLKDTDGDGLSDGEEYNDGEGHFGLGTDPNDADSDNDGFEDGVEEDEGTDPLDAADHPQFQPLDSDGDTLSNDEEVNIHGTNPNDSDSDNDGILDGTEVRHSLTDPMDTDSDGDGLSDFEEYYDGETYFGHDTDPNDSDTDNDAYNDKVEIDAGTDPLDASDHPVETVPVTPSVPVEPDEPVEADEPETPDEPAPVLPSPAGACVDPFTDVPTSHWADQKVCTLYSQGVVKGRTSTLYVPNDFMTRAEYIKVILETAGYDESEGEGLVPHFTDVSGHWAYQYIALADQLGILRNQGGAFNPNGSITRADATVLLIRLAGQTLYGYSQDDIPFWDVYSTDYFAYATIIASDTDVQVEGEGTQSVIEGYTDGSFRPRNAMSRAEVATMALRAQLAWFPIE